MKFCIVVARYNENLEWCKQFSNNASNNASNTVSKEEKTSNNPTNNLVKKKIYFVINNSNNHKSVIDAGLGASEFLFFKTANELTKHYDVVVYNRDTDAKKMDDVEYRFLPPTLNPNIEKSCFVIVSHSR